MDSPESDSPDRIVDSEENALTKYEHELEKIMNESMQNGKDLYNQKLFLSFQNAAKALTKMFRERSNGTANWNSFQVAAGSVTMLYKESLDAFKDAIDLGTVYGEQRKTKELLCWARRKQRRHIRTDEVYDYLIGRPPYQFVRPTPIGSISSQRRCDSSVVRESLLTDNVQQQQQQQQHIAPPAPIDTNELQTFREALVMHDMDSANSVSSSAYDSNNYLYSSPTAPSLPQTPTGTSINSNHFRHQQQQTNSSPQQTSFNTNTNELDSFFRQQVANHLARKRDYLTALTDDLTDGIPYKTKRGRHT
ncbi:unnamed protein product [Didymodactylos carnosus]|uniref:Uncharacterized protein n=1 Tax=Didymodactylos carnosus TaxID=1234261 RepID=A0A813PSH5_9BILA|nr:unnamed protein product [Didymodactylos carnosus]CAF0943160.1 unnamed protein product [Didymodactylos carnosus]CAF3540234.1 unnamed protein product [Didymodactylos carnosus]CAF3717973.1 unnamed protein product [Didymodactylos carnosus]